MRRILVIPPALCTLAAAGPLCRGRAWQEKGAARDSLLGDPAVQASAHVLPW